MATNVIVLRDSLVMTVSLKSMTARLSLVKMETVLICTMAITVTVLMSTRYRSHDIVRSNVHACIHLHYRVQTVKLTSIAAVLIPA